MIRDVESEVRIVAAKSLFTFCEALPDPAENRKNLTVQHIIPYLKDLAIGEIFTRDKTSLHLCFLRSKIFGPASTSKNCISFNYNEIGNSHRRRTHSNTPGSSIFRKVSVYPDMTSDRYLYVES